MSAVLVQATRQLISLLRDTWAENQAHRAKDRTEASGQRANWEECLQAAQNQARELFEPLFSAIDHEHTIIPVLQKVLERLKTLDQESSNRPAA
jgi:hypothetical protein